MSGYKDVVKNIEGMRTIMRDFYIYGFKTRDEFNEKSSRSYDNDSRRLREWLCGYINSEQNREGKNYFISIDSGEIAHNPLYRAFKAKSFTDKELIFHFAIIDVLSDESKDGFNRDEILDGLETFCYLDEPLFVDESTVRKKLAEYEKEGIVISKKINGERKYSLSKDNITLNSDAINYFSEVAPCGVIGSFILDKLEKAPSNFAYKHHYINSAIDSQVLFDLFDAISKKSCVTAVRIEKDTREKHEIRVVPLKIFVGSQDGRQYLIAYNEKIKNFRVYRLDYLSNIKIESVCENFSEYRNLLSECEKNMWSVNLDESAEKLVKVEFTVFVDGNEEYIIRRLEREKRGGSVIKLDNNHYRFSFETYNAKAVIPWIRTFICRITDLYISDDKLYQKFKADLNKIYEIYNIGGGEN